MNTMGQKVIHLRKRVRISGSPQYFVGVDGGGTKTRAVVTDEAGRTVGEAVAGPSNPLRVGVESAAGAVRESIEAACEQANVAPAQIVAAEIGLAGVRRRASLRESVREALSDLGIESLNVVSDADIALFGATDGLPGLVVIAGTGSNCCGINKQGRRACAGGWGPVAGDEGGGAWISRQGLQAIARSTDERAAPTALVEAAYLYFGATNPDELATAIYAPNVTHDRLAGFAKHVIETAQKGDAVARDIVMRAGRELGLAAATVIRKLGMKSERFQVAYVGGVFAAGELIFAPLRAEVVAVAPRAFLAPPVLAPAVAAARMAAQRTLHLALAV